MGDGPTTTQTSGLSSPEMKAAAGTLGSMLNTQLKAGVKPYTGSMVPDLSGQTMAGISAISSNSNDPTFSQAISGALGQQGQLAQGNFGDDPVRQRLMQDVSQNVNSSFLTDGRFGSMGSGGHSDTLARETAGALAPYDMARQNAAIQNLGSLYGMSNMPAAAQLQAGQLMDQYNTARAQDQARIFDATQNAGWNTLQRGGSIFSGTAPVSGTTTTQSQQLPWWQVPAQIGGTVLGAMF